MISALVYSVPGILAAAGLFGTSAVRAPDHARPSLIAELAGVAPGGTISVALRFEMDDGWHIYWDGQNDSGSAPKAVWTLPKGTTISDLTWPTPERAVYPLDVIDYVYHKNVAAIAVLSVPKDAEVGSTITLSASLKWLVCAEQCVMEKGDVTIDIPVVAPDTTPKDSTHAKHFTAARKTTPLPTLVKLENGKNLIDSATTDAVLSGKWERNTLTVSAQGAKGMVFYPDSACSTMSNAIKQGVSKSEALRFSLESKEQTPIRASGIIEVQYPEPRKPAYYFIAVTPQGSTK